MGRALLNTAAGLVILFLLGPLLFVIGGSFTTTKFLTFPPVGFTLSWYERLVHHRDLLDSFIVSSIVAGIACVLSTVIGTVTAVALHQTTLKVREYLRAFVTSPLVLPTVVTGVALYSFFQDIQFDGPWAWLVIGHTIITIPYVVRNVGAALIDLDAAQVEAAKGLGAGWARILWSVIVPVVAPAILVSALLVFIVSFDQVTVSIFLATPDTTPLPVRIYSYLEFGLDPMVAAVSTLMILFAYLLVSVIERLFGLHRLFGKG